METKCSIEIFNKCVPVFEMLKDEQRQALIINIVKHKELNVTELVELSNLSMPAVSHHLKLLTQSGLVVSTKRGTKKYYRLSLNAALNHLEELLASLRTLVNNEGE
ncbi:ArsR/SmtB family transcription factor [Streptococcus gallinaceus]|uniref:DNA-binding transcriptional ArsR family regulator n=1 Tax=Streptococcus gallinaceus TaxID=165758 RepID=A0ABV2JIV0_9STRE|nr:metalloregulator ArsR/SmtB family transcription factor [Streptococcus gallinaceus]MCP1639146.1 DNA-binding transcriptional ArsR family regulator [Streptococcus gallinaceus]MCP1769610.1 DNA-binding transcriptional ArsR family regulator [Streptococcus gallinaceus]